MNRNRTDRTNRRSGRAALLAVVTGTTLIVGMLAAADTAAAAVVSKSKPKAATTTTAGNRQAAFAAYTKCLASHGVKLPTGDFGRRGAGANGTPPSGGQTGTPPANGGQRRGFGQTPPAGVSAKKWAAAQKACASKRPKFGGGGGAAFNAYRACLTRNGVKSGTGANAARPNTSDPKVQAAMQKCAPLRPAGPNGAPGGTGSGGTSATPLQLPS